jgi:cytidylate kinase
MAVVTIARQYGAGARLVGKMVAEQLHYQLVDKEVLHTVARKAGVLVNTVGDIERTSGDMLIRIFNEIYSTSSLTRHVPGVANEFDEGKLRVFLRQTIKEIAARDEVVIIGRGGHFILKDEPRVVRIYLVADERDRVRHMMDQDGVDEERALQIARKEEKKRVAFLQGFDEDIDPDNPTLFHLIINTSLVDYNLACQMICQLVQAKEKNA